MTQNKGLPTRADFAPFMTRREVLALGVGSAAAGVLRWGRAAAASAPTTARSRGARAAALAPLDRFVVGYCAAMNAPGLTLGLADRDGPIRVSAYGYTNLEARVPVSTSDLFEIGSISKSFVALTLLQLHDEGKLDLQAPVRHYLPWLAAEDRLRRDTRAPFADALERHAGGCAGVSVRPGAPSAPGLCAGLAISLQQLGLWRARLPGRVARRAPLAGRRHGAPLATLGDAQYGCGDHERLAQPNRPKLHAASR